MYTMLYADPESLPEDFSETWEYYFEIFFGGDWIELADKQYIVFRFYIGVRQITDLSQSYDMTHVQIFNMCLKNDC